MQMPEWCEAIFKIDDGVEREEWETFERWVASRARLVSSEGALVALFPRELPLSELVLFSEFHPGLGVDMRFEDQCPSKCIPSGHGRFEAGRLVHFNLYWPGDRSAEVLAAQPDAVEKKAPGPETGAVSAVGKTDEKGPAEGTPKSAPTPVKRGSRGGPIISTNILGWPGLWHTTWFANGMERHVDNLEEWLRRKHHRCSGSGRRDQPARRRVFAESDKERKYPHSQAMFDVYFFEEKTISFEGPALPPGGPRGVCVNGTLDL
jgi:hypothetical protein